MMAAAQKQCPGRSQEEIKQLVGKLGASQRGALAGEYAYDREPPEMTGSDVRNIDNHRYNIPAAPREPREVKKYG
jgi:hypothetical protein